MNIFISYGHDKFSVVAKRLKEDLTKEGDYVWIDSLEIKGGEDWELKIENGINDSEWVVLLMTEHSVRRPNGVCLDEISFARQLGKPIAPVMIQEVRPPLCIARVEWIDMVNLIDPEKGYIDENLYKEKKLELIAILKGIYALNHESGKLSLKSILNPLNNDVFSQNFKKNFLGRKQLMDYFDRWYLSDEKLLWITGRAGMGKTAFVAQLASTKECIAAVHFCRYNDNDRANPKKAIMSIVYYLSTQIKDYEHELNSLSDLHNLSEKSVNRLFDYLLVEPLSRIKNNHTKVVVIIDALDEATVDGRNELADVLTTHLELTPDWMKFVITSRKEQYLERKMSRFHTVSMEDVNICNNSDDIQQYLSMMLKEYLQSEKNGQEILQRIVEKSQGVFLYAKTIVEDICGHRRKLSDVSLFPEGLSGIYFDYFERIIGEKKIDDYESKIRPILEILCTAYMPVCKEQLQSILDVDEYAVDDALELIYEMFPDKDNIIEPIHKSIIDWLLNKKRSGKYFVSEKKGHEAIAEHCLRQLKQKKGDPYSLQFVCGHLIFVNREDDLLKLFTDVEFWMQRKKVMDTDFLLHRMFTELSRMTIEVRERLFHSSGFGEVLYFLGMDLFNKGLFPQLKKYGFTVPLHEDMSDKEKLTALRYYYVNGEYATIYNNINLFSKNFEDKIMEPSVQNLLGLVTKKYGRIQQSAEFFSSAIRMASEINKTLESRLHYYLNLSRVLSLLCRFEESRNELEKVRTLFYQNDCPDGVLDNKDDFSSRQTELAVHYVFLETELYSVNCNASVCEKELSWADQLYSSKARIDRYYPRHIQSKIFFLLREHRYDEIIPLFDVLNESDSVEFDKIRTQYYFALYQYAIGQREEGLKTAQKQLTALKEKETLLIERTEFMVLHRNGVIPASCRASRRSLK